jgi:hypothetical protein
MVWSGHVGRERIVSRRFEVKEGGVFSFDFAVTMLYIPCYCVLLAMSTYSRAHVDTCWRNAQIVLVSELKQKRLHGCHFSEGRCHISDGIVHFASLSVYSRYTRRCVDLPVAHWSERLSNCCDRSPLRLVVVVVAASFPALVDLSFFLGS